jgi:N6-L-threonylcarbamoyladenine synthase
LSGTLILGLESSCDETAAAVVEAGRDVRSNVVASQHDLHAEYGGVVPEIASRAHVERLVPVLREAIREAGVSLSDIDAVAVGHRPGLIGSLLVGVSAAKALAWSLDVPIIGVDHVHAHLYAGCLGRSLPDYPALGLVVSGGHTSLYRCDCPTSLTRLGATIDDAIGEAYDKAATILGLPYPGGPNLDALARSPDADDRAIDLPVSRLGRDSLDFSYSGLKTALLYAVRGKPMKGGRFQRDHTALSEQERINMAACFQRAAVRAIMVKLQRAIERVRGDCGTLLVGGGVSANSRLRAEVTEFAERQGLELLMPPLDYCLDNAAMIAGLAFHLLEAGCVSDLSLSPVPTTSC